MDTLSAFAIGQANKNKEQMVFDWIKAAKILKENCADSADAGLSGDFEYTGGEIFTNGKPTAQEETYTYLASTWATPQLLIDGEYIDCFKMKSETPGWDESTFWPQEALDVLNK